jgi:hypothetical protein
MRPVIFTLSLDFFFIFFILLVFSNHLFPRHLLDSHNPSELPVASTTHAQGLKMDPGPFSSFPPKDIERAGKLN